jgi:hypothetical protein
MNGGDSIQTHRKNTPKVYVCCVMRTSWPDGISKKCVDASRVVGLRDFYSFHYRRIYLVLLVSTFFFKFLLECALKQPFNLVVVVLIFIIKWQFWKWKKEKKRGGRETEAQQQHAGRDFTNHFRSSMILTCDDNPYRRSPLSARFTYGIYSTVLRIY